MVTARTGIDAADEEEHLAIRMAPPTIQLLRATILLEIVV